MRPSPPDSDEYVFYSSLTLLTRRSHSTTEQFLAVIEWWDCLLRTKYPFKTNFLEYY